MFAPNPSTAVIQLSRRWHRASKAPAWAVLMVLPEVPPAARLGLNPKMGLSYLGCPI